MFNNALIKNLLVLDISITLIVYGIIVVSHWFIFKKAGEKPWKALIPFYALYTLHKMVWETATFWISMGLLFGSLGLELIFADHPAIVAMLTVLEIFGLGLEVIESIKIAHSFGKGTAFGIFCFFLPFILLPVIAFGKAEYTGPEGEPIKEEL